LGRKFTYVPFNYYSGRTPYLMTFSAPEYKDTFMKAYIDTYIDDFSHIFNFSAPEDLRAHMHDTYHKNKKKRKKEKKMYKAQLENFFASLAPEDSLRSKASVDETS
jgi:hypothetical protein